MELNTDHPKSAPVRMIMETSDEPGMPLYFQFDDEDPVQFATVPIRRTMPLITIDTQALSEMKQDARNPFFCYIVRFNAATGEGKERIFKIFHVYNGINEHLLKQVGLTN